MTSAKEWIKNGYIRYFEYDKFSQITVIDRGGFGKLSRANLDNVGLVALKNILSNNSNIEEDELNEANDKFIKELKLLREVDYHQNINRILGITKDFEYYILVLEYANEGNLRNYLNKNFTSLKWDNKFQMALDITSGLKFLHSKEIIHRDLHSGNILVNNGKLSIADFGLSKKLAEITSNSMGNRYGMVEYIEPQCFKNIKYKKDKKSDIYSLGVLLWEISSGRPPFSECSRDALAFHISYENAREEPIKGTPPVYQKLYQKCWESEPKSRPDIEEVYDILYSNIFINSRSDSEIDNADLNIPSEIILPNNNKIKPRNLVIIGHFGSGKSTLSNVLSNNVDFLESKYSKNFRTQIFEWKGTKYRVFDDIGMGNIILSIQEVLMPEGISQVLLVIDGKLEENTFNLLKDSIFESDIAEYITIVRTKFSSFKSEGECKKDKDNLCKKNETITKLCKSIVHIDNPPINIFEYDEDDKETITINKRRRDQSRTILLDHLDKVPENYYENWDKLFHVGNIFDQPSRSNSDRSASGSTRIKSEKSNFNNLEVGIRNLIIVGRTNSGKSTLAEVLSGSQYYEESAKKKYNVIDAGVTKSIKNIIKLSGGIKKICQILFVIDGKFMADEVKAILDNDIHEHITIVRTKFSNFKNEDKCKKDKEDFCKQNEEVAKICHNIVYVDNPPININVKDEDDKATISLNKKRRDWSRDILLDHLNKVFQEKCDEKCNKIAIEELETDLQSEIPKVMGRDNYIWKFLTNVTKNLTKSFTNQFN